MSYSILRRPLQTTGLLLVLGLVPTCLFASAFESLFSPGELSRAHQEFDQQCNQCHDKSDKSRQDTLCLDCHDHEDIRKDIQDKTGFHGQLEYTGGNDCKQCHREHRGRQAGLATITAGSFKHLNTDFPLEGKHRVVDCHSCHEPEKKYSQAPVECVGCHKEQDVHKGELGRECDSCHVARGWNESGFDHDTVDDFPLRGKHKDTDCQLCHVSNRYKDTPRQCASCHALNDIHGGRYGNKCHSCHQEKGWDQVTFDHNKDTDYRLTGSHKTALCDSCHTGQPYEEKLDTKCISCHQNDDEHKGRNGKQCQDCHSTQQWGKTQFNHEQDTDFALTGKHSELSCNSCHKSSTETKLKTDCYSCHGHADPHQGEMGKDCAQCHGTTGWRAEVFFEHDITRFPLIGMHAVTACEQCHFSQNFSEAPSSCIKCHQYEDEHDGRFGEQCETCHNPNSWKTWLFDHDKQTQFELDGAHNEIECYACHQSTISEHTAPGTSCSSCHAGDDVHRGSFGRHCERCHNTTDFREIEMPR